MRPEPTGVAAAPTPVATSILMGALALGVVAQGGYYTVAHIGVGVGLAAAAIASMRTAAWSTDDLRSAPIVGCGALAVWAVASSAARGHVLDAAGHVALLAGVAAVILICRRADRSQRELLVDAAIALGVVVALSGWAGVAWHIEPWALELQGVWRATTTLTYANVSAGLLVALALISLARLAARPQSTATAVAACLLLTGAGATMSRGGAVAALAGAVVLAGLVGPRRLVRAGTAPLVGAVIALAGLVPSISETSAPRPAVAAVALAGGLVVAGALARATTRILGAVTVAAIAVSYLAFLASGTAVESIADTRLRLADPFRAGAAEGALRIAGDHLLTGAGPGREAFAWTASDGQALVTRYAHNEYLQILAEFGMLGLALVLAIMAAAGRELRRGRAFAPSPATWAGIVAAFAAIAVHSAFDFLWHVPAVVLMCALLLGVVGRINNNTEGSALT